MIAGALERWARETPDAAALVHEGTVRTYAEVQGEVVALAALVRKSGGSLVALAATGAHDAAVGLAAAARAGRDVLVLPPTASPETRAELCARHQADALLEHGRLVPLAPARGGVRAPDGRVVLFTSGTSGAPKPVVHSWRTLAAAVREEPALRGRRWFASYHPTAFAGLQVLAQAWGTGGALVTSGLRDPHALLATLAAARVEVACGTPTFWRMLLAGARGADAPRPALRRITLGGEAVDDGLLDALRDAFPGVKLTHIYASTEMGACITVRDGRAGFPAELLDGGADGGADGAPHLEVRDGELWIRSPRAMRGYLDGAAAPEWFATGDLVELRDGRVQFVGRRSETINVGGSKVLPARVEAVIRSVEGVADAHVRGAKSSMVGEVVAATVVPMPGFERAAVRTAILVACRSRLARHEVPAMVTFADALATTASGKVARHAPPAASVLPPVDRPVTAEPLETR